MGVVLMEEPGLYCCGERVITLPITLEAFDEFAMEIGDCEKCNRQYELFVYRLDEVKEEEL
jgi:hypothetical protein